MDLDQNSADGAGARPALIEALERIAAEVASVQSAAMSCLTDAELRHVVEQAARMRARMEAGYLHLLSGLDQRPEAVPGAATGSAAATFLVHAVKVSPGQAHLDVQLATALDRDGAGITPENAAAADPTGGGLPRVGAALAAGRISRAHANLAYRCLDRIPAHLLSAVGDDGLSGAARVDAFLAEQSARWAPSTTRGLVKQLLRVLDPDGSDRYDPDAFTRRRLSYGNDSAGMLAGEFALDPAAAATFRAVLDAYTKRQLGARETRGGQPDGVTPDGQPTLPLRDERTPAQRKADALHQLCLDALHGAPGQTLREGEQAAAEVGGGRRRSPGPMTPATQVNLVATLGQLAAARAAQPAALDADGHPIALPESYRGSFHQSGDATSAAGLGSDVLAGPLDPGTFGRLLCDTVLYPTLLDGNGAVLVHGREVRFATPAQNRALVARDRGCVVPGCTAPPSRCQAHHVIWWRNNGRTDISNLVLLCDRHHSAVHAGHWRVQLIDGVPWVVPPSWLDPSQVPRRNTVFDAEHHARRLAQRLRNPQLTLDLPDLDHRPGTPSDGWETDEGNRRRAA